MFKKFPPIILFVLALLIYIAFAGWLFVPYFDRFSGWGKANLVAPVVSAAGVFILGRRYVNSFVACFFAGVIYGFGPFASAFYCGFHPFAFCIYAAIPWLFVPAVFFYKISNLNRTITNIISAILSLLPFGFVVVAYFVAARYYFFPMPLHTSLSAKNFIALVSPISYPIDAFSVGFYHSALASLAVGLILFFRTRRFWIAFLFLVAVFLAVYNKPIMDVPPVFWLSFVVLVCSLIAAEGFEAIVLAGRADANWLLLAAAVLTFQAAINSVFFKSPDMLVSLLLLAMCAAAVLFIFFIASNNLAVHYARMLALYTTAMLDVIILTRNAIDSIF